MPGTRPLRRPTPAPRRRWRRPVAAGALLGALAGAWLGTGHDAAAPSSPAARTTEALRARLAHPERCTDVAGPMPTVRCEVDGVEVDVRLLGADAAAAYRREVGVAPRPRHGPAACAAGAPEERSWSRPGAPGRTVGRYDCKRERGRAAMWWNDDRGLLWHALARNGDLGALFTWWRSHPAL